MHRFARFDPTENISRRDGQLAAQLCFGVVCGLLMIAVRSVIDQGAPNVGPFALVYPTILLATLYGHWQAGAAATGVSFFWAWWFVLPIARSFDLGNDGDGWRVIINGASAIIVVVFAEIFRRAVRQKTEQCNREIERGNTLLAELEHRTKNNFQLIVSLLEMQKKRETELSAKLALGVAVERVRSFADVYSKMPVPASEGERVAMGTYLSEIVDRVTQAVFADQVKVTTQIEDLALPRQHAVALGLYTNEALTNCAKHAFPDGRAGTVNVTFVAHPDGWELTIEDSGAGLKPKGPPRRGTGSSLMDAFAKQAHAKHTMTGTEFGCSAHLRSAQADQSASIAAA